MLDSLTLETLLAALYQATWHAMLIALVAWSLTYLLRKQLTPRWRVVFWSLPLFRTLLISLPICSISLYGIFDSSLAGPVNVDLRDRSYTPTNSSTVSPTYTQLDPNPLAQPTSERPTQLPLPPQPATAPSTPPSRTFDLQLPWSTIAIVIWSSGILLLTIRSIRQRIRLRRWIATATTLSGKYAEQIASRACQLGIRQTIRCLVIDAELGPATFGIIRPVILLPRSILHTQSHQNMNAIIEHELQHIQHKDWFWLHLGEISKTLQWFNPFIYWADMQLRQELEHAVDAATIAKLGEAHSFEYGKLLIQLASRSHATQGISSMASQYSSLKTRIRELALPTRTSRARSTLAATLLASIAILFFTSPATSQGRNSPNKLDATTTEEVRSTPSVSIPTDDTSRIVIKGKVLDSTGNPSKGAKVTIVDSRQSPGQSSSIECNASGEFESQIATKDLKHSSVHAMSPDTKQIGIFRLASIEPREPHFDLQMKLEPARQVELMVRNGDNHPVENANAIITFNGFVFLHAITNASGSARFAMPQSERIESVAAWLSQEGFDYHVYRQPQLNQVTFKALPTEFPGSNQETLVLTGAQTVTVNVVDDRHKPIEKARVLPTFFSKTDEPGVFSLAYASGAFAKYTDTSGTTMLDWVPKYHRNCMVSVGASKPYLAARGELAPDAKQIEVTLEREVTLSGQVQLANGDPIAGIKIIAVGVSPDDRFTAETQTDNHGRYTIAVKPEQLYMVIVSDPQWGASPQDGFIVKRDKPLDNIDFQVRKATRLHGRLLDTQSLDPVSDESITITQLGRDLNQSGIQFPITPRNRILQPFHWLSTKSDEEGNYEFFLGDGEYKIGYRQQEISLKVSGEETIELDLATKGGNKVKLVGELVESETGAPLPKAVVIGITHAGAPTWQAVTNQQGKFEVQRIPETTYIFGVSEDQSQVVLTKINAIDTTIKLEAAQRASVTGTLITEDGKPIPNYRLNFNISLRAANGVYSRSCETNAEGEFQYDSLLPGEEYMMLGQPDASGAVPTLRSFRCNPGESLDLGFVEIPRKPSP